MTLASSSSDLVKRRVESIVLRHVEARSRAWQYVDWLFDGDDMVAGGRTVWDSSHNAHDADCFNFH